MRGGVVLELAEEPVAVGLIEGPGLEAVGVEPGGVTASRSGFVLGSEEEFATDVLSATGPGDPELGGD